MEIHVHIHNSDHDKKLDQILEAICNRNENEFNKEIKEVIRRMKISIKDLKKTPLK